MRGQLATYNEAWNILLMAKVVTILEVIHFM